MTTSAIRAFDRLVAGISLVTIAVLFAAPDLGAQVINEFVANHTGIDNYEYIEVYGAPSTNYSALTLIQIDGDTAENRGVLDSAMTVGTTDANGFWVTNFLVDELDNGTMSLLLVTGYNGTPVLTDLDTNDDGVLDIVPWSSVVDGVAVLFLNAPASDRTYTTPVLVPNFDGISIYEPGGASRIPDGTDTGTDNDWHRNDFSGAGLPGFTGYVTSFEAYNTPGAANAWLPPPIPVINEFVFDHVGSDVYEFVEIAGPAGETYFWTTLLVIDGDDSSAGVVTAIYPMGSFDDNGYWTTGYLNDVFDNGSQTLLLVAGFMGSLSQDLDTDNDGVFDLTPWDEIYDSVAVDDGGADRHYSATILDAGWSPEGSTPGGGSRIPDAIDTDTSADWVLNDFDGEGLGIAGNAGVDEALNTRASVNRQSLIGYYAHVAGTTGASLRTSVHEVIDDHKKIPYTSFNTDAWDVLNQADTNPANSNQLLTVYRNEAMLNTCSSDCDWQREHTWPKSYGFADDDESNYPYSDCYTLRPAIGSYNSARFNYPFGTCDGACAEYVTVANNSFGGVGGAYPGDSNWRNPGAKIWEVWGHRRGDVARAQLYMDVRYEGGTHGVSGFSELDLKLTDNMGLVVSGQPYMGRLSVLLQWHEEDPVDAEERTRNNVVATYQGNRNPFVDHPEWVECIFQDGFCPVFSDSFESGDLSAWSSTVP